MRLSFGRYVPRGSYVGSALFGAGTRGVSLAAQVLALLAMAWLMRKGDFGDLMTAFAVYRVLSYGIGTGCAAGILYHVSRDPTDETEIRAHRTFAVMGGVIVAVAVALLLLAAPEIAAVTGKPRIAFWLYNLAPFGILSTLVTLAAGASDGRHRINYSIFLVELLPNVVRLVLLAALLALRADPVYVAWALALSMLVPWLLVMARLANRETRGFRPITAWDAHYTGRYILHSLLSMQLQGVDMMVVGYLFSSTVAADYAIAGRIAALFPFLQQVVLKKFTPRAGKLIADHQIAELDREANLCRRASVMAVSLLTAAMLAVAPLVLRGAGDFTTAFAILVALATPSFARSFFAGGDAILRMAGQASFSLAIMAASFVFVVATPIVAGRWLGIFSLPVGMALSAVVLNPLIVVRVHRLFGFWLLSVDDVVVLTLGLAILIAAALLASPDPVRALMIGAAAAVPGALVALLHARRFRPALSTVIS